MKKTILLIALSTLSLSPQTLLADTTHGLKADEVKSLRETSQALLVSRVHLKKRIEQEKAEEIQKLSQAQNALLELENAVKGERSPLFNRPSAVADAVNVSFAAVKHNNPKIRLNPDTMGFVVEQEEAQQLATTNEEPVVKAASSQSNLTAKLVARQQRIKSALDRALSRLDDLSSSGELQTLSIADSQSNKKNNIFKNSGQRKKHIQDAIGRITEQLYAMQEAEAQPSLKQVKQLRQQLQLQTKQPKDLIPQPTFTTLTKHR